MNASVSAEAALATARDDTQPSDVTLPSLLQIAHCGSELAVGIT